MLLFMDLYFGHFLPFFGQKRGQIGKDQLRKGKLKGEILKGKKGKGWNIE